MAPSSRAERLSKVTLILAGSESLELSQKIGDAIDYCKLSVGMDHPITLNCMDSLGLSWKNRRELDYLHWSKAEIVLLRIIQKRILL